MSEKINIARQQECKYVFGREDKLYIKHYWDEAICDSQINKLYLLVP